MALMLLILGLDNAGKTTILKKLKDEDIGTITPTAGFNIKSLEHRSFSLTLWDIGGQRKLRPLWRNYCSGHVDGLIWVVDSADRQRLQECKEELSELLFEEGLAGASLLILANKQDLPGALTSDQIRLALDLDSVKTHYWKIAGCSAVSGTYGDLLESIDWIVDSKERCAGPNSHPQPTSVSP